MDRPVTQTAESEQLWESNNKARQLLNRFPSARALIIGIAASLGTCVLVTHAELVIASIRIGYLQFPPAAFGVMLLLVALSRGLRLIHKRLSLSSSDLLVIYCMSLVAAMVSSHGIVQKFIPLLVAEGYFSNSTNGWASLYGPYIQNRQVPYAPQGTNNQHVLSAYYGRLLHGDAVPWSAWITPVLTWSVLIGLVVFAFLCLMTLLRKQWVDNEKLSFPLARLPMEVAVDQEGGGFFRNPLMWLGVLIPFLVYGIKALHQGYPTVPPINLTIVLTDLITSPPYNQLAYTPMVLSFAALGFFYLLPVDILFSVWFFFVLSRLEQLIAISYNMDTPGMPLYPPLLFTGYQTVGAYVVLAGYFFWIGRPHLIKVWKTAIGQAKEDDSDEIMPYRVAVFGLIFSIVASSLWLWSMGMSLWLAVFELFIFLFVIAIIMARSTAEAGMMMTETTFRPVDLIRMFVPLHDLGPQNLTQLAFFDNMFLRDQRGLLLTGMLDAAKISDSTNIRRRSFLGVLALGIVTSFVAAVALNIFLPYHIGATKMDPWMEAGSPSMTFQDYAPYFHAGVNPISSNAWQMPVFFIVGVLTTIALTVMRTAFHWWPLHPLGYALSGSWSTVEFWFPCLLAWGCKSLTLRYGGMKFYLKARPFFLGLIIGEFGSACILVLLSIFFKFPSPEFPWG